MKPNAPAARLRIYLGEDKELDRRPLYLAILKRARQCGVAGATVIRGTQGYGRSTRLHTADVLFSEDLPVIIELIDAAEVVDAFLASLAGIEEIGLITREPVTIPPR